MGRGVPEQEAKGQECPVCQSVLVKKLRSENAALFDSILYYAMTCTLL